MEIDSQQSEELEESVKEIDYKDKMKVHLRIPFPTS